MNRIVAVAIILVSILSVSLGLLPTIASAEAPNKYVLDAKLNYEQASLDVKETASYTNVSLKTLTSIVFNVTPAHFKAFALKQSTIDGTTVEAKVDGVVMELPLPKPLEPGQTARIELAFTLDVPRQGGRFGFDQGILALGNWYPVFAAYRDGWDRHQYNDFGDPFFTEFGDYDLTLTVSSDVKIAHSGDVVSHDGNVWRFKGEALRDFSLAISDKYETRTTDVGGVTVTAFYLPQARAVGSLYLDVAERTLQWYQDRIGPYTAKTLDVAMVSSNGSDIVGQEYPGVVFVASNLTDTTGGAASYLAYAVSHEIGHQWFYAQVGNDQTKDGWLSEALATFLGYRVIGWPPLTLKSPAVIAAGNLSVNPSIYEFKDESTYVAAVYGKGSVFLQDLSIAMTDETFYSMLRAYVQIYKQKIARPEDFFSLAQSFSKKNLNPIIQKYFSYPEYQANAAPGLTVLWPAGSEWQGSVEIPFEIEATARQATVDIDGQIILRQDNPNSPLTVDVSRLNDNDYVARVAITDDKGGFAEQAQRVRIIRSEPTPPGLVQSQPSTPNNVNSNPTANADPVDRVDKIDALTPEASDLDIPRYLLYGVAAVIGLVTLVVFGSVILNLRRTATKLEYPIKAKKQKG